MPLESRTDPRDRPPIISVVIPAYNAAQTLPLQLEALQTQIDAPPFEVIVVDNASSDDLSRVIEPFQASDLDVRLLRAIDHQGASYARNAGIAASRADLLMFCDADDVVSARWVAQGAAAFGAADLWTGTAILLPEGSFDRSLEGVRELFDAPPAPNDRVTPAESEISGELPVMMGGNFGARRDLLVRLGGFDQSFPLAGDDNDLAFRARRAGQPLSSAAHVRVGCRGHWAASDQLRISRRSARAHCLLMQRYDAWSSSRMPAWHVELLRCFGAGLKMLLRMQPRDWFGLAQRATIALGLAEGTIRYRWLRRIPPAQIGLGLSDADASRTGTERHSPTIEELSR